MHCRKIVKLGKYGMRSLEKHKEIESYVIVLRKFCILCFVT